MCTDKQSGVSKIFFDIVKKYPDDSPVGIGKKIDYHGSWMFNEGVYFSEFLVDKDFVKEELDKDCDLELIETDLFSNLYEYNREYFADYWHYNKTLTGGILGNVAKLYEDDPDELNEKSRQFSFLNRYFEFKKKKVVVKGGGINPREEILKPIDGNPSTSLVRSIFTALSNGNFLRNTRSDYSAFKELLKNNIEQDKLSNENLMKDFTTLKKLCSKVSIDINDREKIHRIKSINLLIKAANNRVILIDNRKNGQEDEDIPYIVVKESPEKDNFVCVTENGRSLFNSKSSIVDSLLKRSDIVS
jgi:ketosteroid isomerase-like protein